MISIIIANWNGKKWLKGCFDSIFQQTHRDFEIIFADNASGDDSVQFVRDNYPEIRIAENHKNLGFAKANNIGARAAKGDILFFLNNDTILENNTLEKLIAFKQEKDLNITGPKILDFEGKNVYRGKKLTIDPAGYLGWGKATFYIEGCALMISKDDFARLEGFDEKYFMYSEDIDLCWRAWLAGMKLDICNEASIKHFGGGSSEATRLQCGKHRVPIFRRYESEKNNLRSVLKNYRAANLLWILPVFLIETFFESLLYLITGNLAMFSNLWKAIFWNIANINNTLAERRSVQGKRKVGDGEIFSKMNWSPNKLSAVTSAGLPKFQ